MTGVLIPTEHQQVTASLPPIPVKWEGWLTGPTASVGTDYYVVYAWDGWNVSLAVSERTTG